MPEAGCQVDAVRADGLGGEQLDMDLAGRAGRLHSIIRSQAQALFDRDPDLKDPENSLLGEALVRFWGGGKGDVS